MPDHHAKWQQFRKWTRRVSVARLGPGDLEVCVELDSIAMGGFWSEAQWPGELEGSRRYVLAAMPQEPRIRLVPDVCLGIACGWLVLDELHITLVMVRPPWRSTSRSASVRRGVATVTTALVTTPLSSGNV